MKYLILLLLILSSCTDKKESQESSTQDMLIVFEDSEELQTNTKPLVASYEIKSDHFYAGQQLIIVSNNDDSFINTNSFIVWDSNTDNYYWIGFNIETNNIQYQLNPQYQTITSLDSSIPYNPNLIFAGYLPIEHSILFYGLYVDTNTSILYKATIHPLSDDGDEYWDLENALLIEGTEHLPVYPTRNLQSPSGKFTGRTYYTNKQGQVFKRSTYNEYGGLYLLSVILSNNILILKEE